MKQYFDIFGREIKPGVIIIYPTRSSCKGGRGGMNIGIVGTIDRGIIEFESADMSRYTWQRDRVQIASALDGIRVVSPDFAEAWKDGSVFVM